MVSIGEQIANARKARGITQKTLAEMLNVSRSTVANWENGRRLPDGETLLQLSRVLSYSFESESTIADTAVDVPMPAAEESDKQETVISGDLPDEEQKEAADEKTAAEAPAPEVLSEAAAVSAPNQKKLQPRTLYGIGIAVLVIVALFLSWFFFLRSNEKVYSDDTGSKYKIEDFTTPAENVPGKAYLHITPILTITEGENYNYWMYTFKMYELNGVACKVDRVEEFIFGPDKLVHRIYGAGDIQAYGVSVDIPASGQWEFSGGFPVQNILCVCLKVSVTDENNEKLSFVTYMPLTTD